MADSIVFTNNTVEVKNAANEAIESFLYEVGELIKGQAADNSRVDQGQLRDSWDFEVNMDESKVTIGSPEENSIWEEFGTGEYAVKHNGREGGWVVHSSKLSAKAKRKLLKIGDGEFYFTRGKKPHRTLEKAYNTHKSSIQRRAEEIFKVKLK